MAKARHSAVFCSVLLENKYFQVKRQNKPEEMVKNNTKGLKVGKCIL